MLGVSCKSSDNQENLDKTNYEQEKNDLNSQQSEILSVEIAAITRGHRENISITPEKMEFYSTQEKLTKEIDKKEWENLISEINAVGLETIPSYKAPTEKRLYDGDLATTLTIKTKDATYQSQTFDKKTPPKELVEIVNTVYGFKE